MQENRNKIEFYLDLLNYLDLHKTFSMWNVGRRTNFIQRERYPNTPDSICLALTQLTQTTAKFGWICSLSDKIGKMFTLMTNL